MPKPTRFSPEVRTRAVRMFMEHEAAHASQWTAITSIAEKISYPLRPPLESKAALAGRGKGGHPQGWASGALWAKKKAEEVSACPGRVGATGIQRKGVAWDKMRLVRSSARVLFPILGQASTLLLPREPIVGLHTNNC